MRGKKIRWPLLFTVVPFFAPLAANDPINPRFGSSPRAFLSTSRQAREACAKLPLSFEANLGQTDSRVRFLSRGPGYTLFLTPNEAVLVSGKAGSQALRMKLLGANPSPEIEGTDQLPGQSYYFIGNDPQHWHSKVPNYARVRYRAVYPGVDLVYYGNQRKLEYDFVVAPGTDPKSIGLSFQGARAIRIDHRSGDLRLDWAGSEVRLHKPVAYQTDNGKHGVEARYVLKPGKRVGIEVGSYDPGRPLVIDPVLAYSTYLGGNAGDQGNAIAVDSSGNAYVAGSTGSADFPTVHPLPPPNNVSRNSDAFISKLHFDSATSTLSLGWSAYLGGSRLEEGTGIAVDFSGNAYVTGTTTSTDFPTVHPLPTPPLRGQVPFASKLSFDSATSTLSLVWSTYLGGGSRDDEGTGIAVDSSGNAYVTGVTISIDFPTVHPLPAPNNALQGVSDAYVSKLSFDSTTSTLSLTWSTYLGGSSIEFPLGIAVDSSGNAYVTGITSSTDFPTAHPLPAPNNALQSGLDAFVSKLSFDSTTSTLSLAWSTYLGGNGIDIANGIAADASGNAYVTGLTASTDFPTAHPLPAPNNALQGFNDAFVSKLGFDITTSMLSLAWSTYLGGSNVEFGNGIAVDSSGNAYVTGVTFSTDFPTVDPLAPPNNALQGTQDAFVSKLSFDNATSRLSLAYSTYLGGSGQDQGKGIAVDAFGNAFVTGSTASNNFPTVNALPAPNDVLQGGSDAFVAKLAPMVPFASASARLEIAGRGFELNEWFTLGAGSDGINPLSENVTLQIGTFSITIPAGSFHQDPRGRFVFEGVIHGVSLEVQIEPRGNNSFTFKAEAAGVDLSRLTNPVTVVLTIGDDSGRVVVAAEFE